MHAYAVSRPPTENEMNLQTSGRHIITAYTRHANLIHSRPAVAHPYVTEAPSERRSRHDLWQRVA